jgi:protein SCO1/2
MRGLVLCSLALLVPAGLHAGSEIPPALQGVKLDAKPGDPVPRDVVFRHESGRDVPISELFLPERPAVLLFAYYRCPMLCGLALNRLAASLAETDRRHGLRVGTDFAAITVSIDPREGPELAAAKKGNLLRQHEIPGAEEGWHFLTGQQPAVRRLAQAMGYRYRYDLTASQYAHPAGVLVLGPNGRVARVIHGIDVPPDALAEALRAARSGTETQPAAERTSLLFCYGYDPERGSVQELIINVVRACGVLTVLGLAALVWRLNRRAAKAGAGA